MLKIYKFITKRSENLLCKLLEKRVSKGKEDAARLSERKGLSSYKRPDGPLIWLHAASVGEAQSSLSLIHQILQYAPHSHVLVTTGTVTSAELMSKNLPERAIHQFYPLDHPKWATRFLDHWQPNLVLWIESELWPNMLNGIKERKTPSFLVNGRLSDRSFKRWRLFKHSINSVLSTFQAILAQTEQDAMRFRKLGAQNVHITDNLKYSAKALPVDDNQLKMLQGHTQSRPVWLYASSHAGEETLACRVHQTLKAAHPELLTIIVPRHPERAAEIEQACRPYNLSLVMRDSDQRPPENDTDIYIANTLGELGLFYRAAPIACIGRSFSDDGGGGHNPIEAAQLHCAVLHGPNVQYQTNIFNEMNAHNAAIMVKDEAELTQSLHALLSDESKLAAQQKNGLAFAQHKEGVIERVMDILHPSLDELNARAITDNVEAP